jgi:hypothetical protein
MSLFARDSPTFGVVELSRCCSNSQGDALSSVPHGWKRLQQLVAAITMTFTYVQFDTAQVGEKVGCEALSDGVVGGWLEPRRAGVMEREHNINNTRRRHSHV